MRSRNWAWAFCREIRWDCLRYFPLGNQGDSLGGRFGGNLWGNHGCKLWTEKKSYTKKIEIPTLDKLMIFMKWDDLVCLNIRKIPNFTSELVLDISRFCIYRGLFQLNLFQWWCVGHVVTKCPSVRSKVMDELRTVRGGCRIGSLVVEAQQEAPYAFSPRIYHLNYYAVLRLLICSLSGHGPEEARVRYLETRGALNSRSIQGISHFLLVIQSVQLRKSSIICFLSNKSFNYRIKVFLNTDNTLF